MESELRQSGIIADVPGFLLVEFPRFDCVNDVMYHHLRPTGFAMNIPKFVWF